MSVSKVLIWHQYPEEKPVGYTPGIDPPLLIILQDGTKAVGLYWGETGRPWTCPEELVNASLVFHPVIWWATIPNPV